jgi:4-carboxymuconolactone decarboxylase
MKTSTAVALALSLGSAGAIAETGAQRGPLSDTTEAVSPALERYASTRLAGDLWKRNDLSPRDRSLVTVAAVIARNQTVLLPEQLELALKNGVKPAELSETITQLAFYAGWGNAIAAAAVTKEIFLQKGINAEQLPRAEEALLPIDEKLKQLALHA